MDIAQLIRDESAKYRALHERVHQTCLRRHVDPASQEAWRQACKAFHAFRSSLDPLFERAFQEITYCDKTLIEFVICFLEADPRFFRSGYIKQVLLTRIKRSVLCDSDQRRLRGVCIDAVNRRGGREFKYYSRLAAALADDLLITQLEDAAGGAPAARVARARIMLARIRQRRTEIAARRHSARVDTDSASA
jgi:hypothetical protein